jgi:hypothetical protein
MYEESRWLMRLVYTWSLTPLNEDWSGGGLERSAIRSRPGNVARSLSRAMIGHTHVSPMRFREVRAFAFAVTTYAASFRQGESTGAGCEGLWLPLGDSSK